MPKKEPDSLFLMKIILYFLIGQMWVVFDWKSSHYSLPFGFAVGLYFAHHEHFQIDRKIEYAILLIATIASYILPIGFLLKV